MWPQVQCSVCVCSGECCAVACILGGELAVGEPDVRVACALEATINVMKMVLFVIGHHQHDQASLPPKQISLMTSSLSILHVSQGTLGTALFGSVY